MINRGDLSVLDTTSCLDKFLSFEKLSTSDSCSECLASLTIEVRLLRKASFFSKRTFCGVILKGALLDKPGRRVYSSVVLIVPGISAIDERRPRSFLCPLLRGGTLGANLVDDLSG